MHLLLISITNLAAAANTVFKVPKWFWFSNICHNKETKVALELHKRKYQPFHNLLAQTLLSLRICTPDSPGLRLILIWSMKHPHFDSTSTVFLLPKHEDSCLHWVSTSPVSSAQFTLSPVLILLYFFWGLLSLLYLCFVFCDAFACNKSLSLLTHSSSSSRLYI